MPGNYLKGCSAVNILTKYTVAFFEMAVSTMYKIKNKVIKAVRYIVMLNLSQFLKKQYFFIENTKPVQDDSTGERFLIHLSRINDLKTGQL